MSRIISLAHLTVIELTPPEVVQVGADAGYNAVDLRLAKAIPEDRVYPVFGDTPMLRELKQRMDDTGVRVYDVEIIRARRDLDVASFEPLFVAAAALGAQRIKVVSDEPDEAALIDVLSALCAAAAPYGLTIDLEFMLFTQVKSIAQAVRVVNTVRQSQRNCCVLIDTLHFFRSGGQPADLDGCDASLFHYLQLCDAPAAQPPDLAAVTHEARTGRLIPGEGELPLAAVLSRLPADRPVSLELPMKELAARMSALERARLSIAGARRLLAQVDGH